LKVFTIGTSTRSLREFLELLKGHGISLVADIRRFPTSRFEHFRKENLEKSLHKEGIKYFHFHGFGGYRGGYRKHMKSTEFKEAFKELLSIAGKESVVLMCAERLFFRCHRKFIADELIKQGIKVVHIIDEKRTYEHKPCSSPRIFSS